MLEDIDIIMRVFILKNLYTKCIEIGGNYHNSRCPYKPYEISLMSTLSLLVKSFEEDIKPSGDCADTVRG